MHNVFDKLYKPDVLSCLADLHNDEIKTPPKIANQLLDLLPKEVFSNKEMKFLDPCTKSGVFLREIARRLIDGEKDQFDSLEECVNWVCHNQVFGIATTEISSLLSRRSVYCSKYPNGPFSIAKFEKDDVQGNVLYHTMKHSWIIDGDIKKCSLCGAPYKDFGETVKKDGENHAYEFIHTTNPEEIFNMKFDVIIGNPPYQLDDGGNGKSAKPIYQYFVQQAKKLNPQYLVMIIPARWYSGGKGLDDFRKEMLKDHSISKLVDYENYKDVFPSVDGLAGGVCYFLRDKNYNGPCEITNRTDEIRSVETRSLDEFDVFIRSNDALSIVHRVLDWCRDNDKSSLSKVVSSRKPFGLSTNYAPKKKGIPCQFKQRIGKQFADPKDVDDSKGYLNKWKLLVPKSPIAGQTDFSSPVKIYYESNTQIAAPGECCTESFIILGAFDTEQELLNFKSYLYTRTVRFLLLQTVVSQDITKKNFCFVPDLGTYDREYTDEYLFELWGITDETEQEQIKARILSND